MPSLPPNQWIVCQLGAREHYAIARALQRSGALDRMITDLWVPPGHLLAELPGLGRFAGARRLRGRYHHDLANAQVLAPNLRTLAAEVIHRLNRHHGAAELLARYTTFQKHALDMLTGHFKSHDEPRTLFSYSNTALELFRFAKERGWTTVLGQVDPGPEEHRIVAAEQQRYGHLGITWNTAPAEYWDAWYQEIDLADRIIVNSQWSYQCLSKEGVPATKLEIIPLVYDAQAPIHRRPPRPPAPLQVLFLGHITLRKGIGRLLDVMHLLKDEPIQLTLAGATTINPSAWADLPNVRWTGPVPRSDVNALYDAADVFILPTLSDGYALTQLEALARGLPVIASKFCGQAVIHGVNGWILDDLEPETIAATLRSLDPATLQGPVQIETSFDFQQLGKSLCQPQPPC